LKEMHGTYLGIETGDYEHPMKLISESLEIARSHKDMELECSALFGLATQEFFHGDLIRAKAYLDQALPLLEGTKSINTLWGVLDLCGQMARCSGQPDVARAMDARAMALAESRRDRVLTVFALANTAWTASLTGDWKELGAICSHPLAVESRERRLLIPQIMAAKWRGQPERVESLTARYSHSNLMAYRRITDAWELGRTDDLAESAESVRRELLTPGWERIEQISAQLIYAVATALKGELVTAARAYEQASELADWPLPFMMLEAGTRRALGFVAWKLGRLDEAKDHYASDVERMRKAGYRPNLAWSCFEFSELLMERRSGKDKGQAKVFQDEALTIARDLSMRPLTERILRRRQFLKA